MIEPRKGTLEKGEKAIIRVSFYPKERKNYSAIIPVKVDKVDQPFLEFEVKGNGYEDES